MFKSFFKYSEKKCICNAPFASMYFRTDGSVTPCCFNTEYVYGKYPEKTVAEIWQGKAIHEFREFMKNNDLSHGCQICRGHIAGNNIEAAGLKHFKNLQLNKKKPVKFEFELSHQCNLNCIMCSQPKDIKLNAKIYTADFVEQISEFLPYIKGLFFLGGEPFSIEIYYQIWELVNKTNPECINYIQTNGTIWNERIKNIIEHGRYQISVSLDSVDENIYEDIRINAKLNRTLENVNHFNNYMKSGNEILSFAVCPMRNNALNIPDIIRFATKINANVFYHTVFTPRKLTLISCPKKYLEFILKNYEDFLSVFKEISDYNKRNFQVLINQIKTFIKQSEEFIPYLHEDLFSGSDEAFSIEINYENWENLISIDPKCEIFVQTNGTILNSKIKDILSRGNFRIEVSMESLRKETFESIRNNDNFNKVMENTLFFHNYCKSRKIPFSISTCVIRQNWRELPDIIHFCNDLESVAKFHEIWFPEEYSLYSLKKAELQEIYNYLSSCDFPEMTGIQSQNKNNFNCIVSIICEWLENAGRREEEFEIINCLSGKELFSFIKEKITKEVNKKKKSETEKKTLINNCIYKIETLSRNFDINTQEKILKLLGSRLIDSILFHFDIEEEIEQASVESLIIKTKQHLNIL